MMVMQNEVSIKVRTAHLIWENSADLEFSSLEDVMRRQGNDFGPGGGPGDQSSIINGTINPLDGYPGGTLR